MTNWLHSINFVSFNKCLILCEFLCHSLNFNKPSYLWYHLIFPEFIYRRVSLVDFSEKQYQNWAQNIEYNSSGRIREKIEREAMTNSIFQKNLCQWVQLRQHTQITYPYIKSELSTKKKVRLNVAFICFWFVSLQFELISWFGDWSILVCHSV